MEEKVYFAFFILCAIVSQGILAKLLDEEDVEEASKLLVRQKRVIDRRPGQEKPLTNGEAPYVVNLKKYKRFHCMGSILSRHTVITAARCVNLDLRLYTIHSGSSYSHRGLEHNVTERKMHGHSPSRTILFPTGIALVTVDPPFQFSPYTYNIDLHTGPVLEGMEGTVAGWGTRVNSGPIETEYSKRLRSINVSVMNHRVCQNIYREHFPITEEDVCTYHPQKLCGDTDAGAALVIDNHLAGVYLGGVLLMGTECPVKPDVFVLLQHANYRSWILSNIVH